MLGKVTELHVSFDNWGTCWATHKVSKGLWMAMDEMADLGSQGLCRVLSRYHKGSEAATLLSLSWSPAAPRTLHPVATSLHNLHSRFLAQAKKKISYPHSEHQQAASFNIIKTSPSEYCLWICICTRDLFWSAINLPVLLGPFSNNLRVAEVCHSYCYMGAKELIYWADNVTHNTWEHTICSLTQKKEEKNHTPKTTLWTLFLPNHKVHYC